MGLDQYAYVAARAGQLQEFYDSAKWSEDAGDFVATTVSKPEDLAYWRKHPNLQGWMEQLWEEKGKPNVRGGGDIFNGVELELTWEDITRLEQDIRSGKLASLDTTGFFFGKPSDNHYYEQDLKFCQDAKAELFLGVKVFYNSSW